MPSLTIALLGATGNVGGHYARLALDAGHSLRALARNPAKLDPIIPNGADHPNVTAITGDATNTDDVANLIEAGLDPSVLIDVLEDLAPPTGANGRYCGVAKGELVVNLRLSSLRQAERVLEALQVVLLND